MYFGYTSKHNDKTIVAMQIRAGEQYSSQGSKAEK
jgi:hypothetical protein